MLSRDECRAVVDRVLAASRADEVAVDLGGGRTSHLRFARNAVSTSGSFVGDTLTVTSTFGRRSGTATVNQLDDATLELAVRRSEEIARVAPEDPEHVPGPGPQDYLDVDAWSKVTESGGAYRLVDGVELAIAGARATELVAAGFGQFRTGMTCTANSNGLFGTWPSTEASFSETARTPSGTGSGWASSAAVGVESLDFAGISSTAIDKARRSADPRPLEPGRYVTILEPACVANLLWLLVGAMDRRGADEGRNFFSAPGGGTRLGEQVFPETVDIRTDPDDRRVPGRPWGEDGLARTPRDLVRAGTIASLDTDRAWAAKTGIEPVASPANLLMKGAGGGVDDLVRSTERGILITSLWYIRSVDQRTLLHTGLTRDGVFWIEDGEIVRPVTNFRWNDSPVRVLQGVLEMSRAVRVPPRPSGSANTVVPALKVDGFTLSSVSEAV